MSPMGSRPARTRKSAAGEAAAWKARHEALLDVVNAILYAYGDGADGRLAISHAYYRGKPRRAVVLEDLGGRLVVRFDVATSAAASPKLSLWRRILRRLGL